MRTFISLATAAVAIAISYGDPQSTVPQPASKPDPNRIICQDRVATGSRLAYARDCHTQAEWDQIKRGSQDWVNGIQQRSFTSNNPPHP